MNPGTHVKALKNSNRVEVGAPGIVVDNPKGGLTKPDQWAWVKFEKHYHPKLMKVSELEVVGPIDYIV